MLKKKSSKIFFKKKYCTAVIIELLSSGASQQRVLEAGAARLSLHSHIRRHTRSPVYRNAVSSVRNLHPRARENERRLVYLQQSEWNLFLACFAISKLLQATYIRVVHFLQPVDPTGDEELEKHAENVANGLQCVVENRAGTAFVRRTSAIPPGKRKTVQELAESQEKRVELPASLDTLFRRNLNDPESGAYFDLSSYLFFFCKKRVINNKIVIWLLLMIWIRKSREFSAKVLGNVFGGQDWNVEFKKIVWKLMD